MPRRVASKVVWETLILCPWLLVNGVVSIAQCLGRDNVDYRSGRWQSASDGWSWTSIWHSGFSNTNSEELN